MRHVNVQPAFPGMPQEAVCATLTLAISDGGLVTVGWAITSLTTLEELALGCLPPVMTQDATGSASDVLSELWEAAAIVLDLPPFL
jgi:hypothetical protein